jgi:hypothetical protein
MQKASVPNEPPMSFWQFVWREVKQRITIGLLVLLVALFALPSLRPRPADWWDWIDALISLLTLGTAFFIWMGQLRRAWEEYLPNRLTIHFYYNGREVMRCEKAHLTNESDIRAFGQQIGMQMAGGTMLSYRPTGRDCSSRHGWRFAPPETNSKERYTHHTARYYLRELPKALSKIWVRTRVLVWRPPFDNGPANGSHDE